MNKLIINPSYNCPFNCNFCYNKNNNDSNTLLGLKYLDEFLSKYSKKFDCVSISGGEPSLLLHSYLIEMIDIIKKYFNEVEIQSYPIKLLDKIDGVKYNFSYDFLARPRAREAWVNIVNCEYDYDITITLSQLMFKYHPNKVLYNLTLLKNLKTVHFKPYFRTNENQKIISHYDYQKFTNLIKSSNLNLNYDIKIFELNDDYILNPDGKLLTVKFNDDIMMEYEITPKEIGKIKIEYPYCVRV